MNLSQKKKEIIYIIKERYKTKIEIENNNTRGPKNVIITDEEEIKNKLGDILIYTKIFLFQLWENPKSIATIILNVDINDIKGNLANFVVNNLYNDTKNEEQIIYIITLLLKKEINNLNNTEPRCRMLLEEFYKKKEVKLFFKAIFFDIFKKLENTYSLNDLNLNIDKIKEKINDNKFEKDDIIDDKNNIEIIKNNYINKEINLELLGELMKKYKNENDDITLFVEKIKSDLSKFPDDYSINNFLEKINSNKEIKENIMIHYISSFIRIADIIDIFFNNLLKSIDIMPYSIKCICKIIYILINKNNSNNKSSLEKLYFFLIYY